MAKGIGLAHPLPSLPLHSILFAPECLFNLISISKITHTLNCSITFSDKSVILQDRSTGKTIGIGRESQSLYHLHLLQHAFPPMLLFSFTVVWVILVSPSSRRWSLVFPLCRRLRVSRVSLGNILMSRSQSVCIIRQSLILNLSTMMLGVLIGPRLL